MSVKVRRAEERDRAAVEQVESQATPRLRYLPHVFDEFAGDEMGEFSVAEVDGEIAGCGKFTVLPDRTAWLEALRVMPSHQGKGVGKAFYERFFELARAKDIKTMRMYTGTKNVVSKGLAERFGFTLAVECRGSGKVADAPAKHRGAAFTQVTDTGRAVELLMPYKDRWNGFVVMNRTFYELTPALCEDWARTGKVFEETSSGSVVALGARFMPEQAVHIAVFGGDDDLCLSFAAELAAKRGAKGLQLMFPPSSDELQAVVTRNGFVIDGSDYIVMQVSVSS